MPRARAAVALAVAALVGIHCALALSATRTKSQSFDETAHLTAGYAFWRFDDYRLQPENGNLPQRLAALPLVLFGDVAFPPLDQEAWRKSDVWRLGDQFLHSSGNDLRRLLLRGRAAMCLLSAALCLAVFAWARALHGTAGGFVALALCAFSPMILANGPLATSDTAAALFFLLGARSLWALFGRITIPGALACAASISGLALSKTSAALILPMAALMIPAALLARRSLLVVLPRMPPRRLLTVSRRLAAMAVSLLVCLLVAWGSVWAAFGFRYAPAPPAEQARFERYYWPGTEVYDLEGISAIAGTPGEVVAFAGRHRLLPEAFLYGTSFVFASLRRYAFLNGELSTSGWRHFFPYCFLVKSTLPLLLLCATALLALLAAVARRDPIDPGRRFTRAAFAATAPLWILIAVYGASLLTTTINLGARHMLPVYPALFVLLGGLARMRDPAGLRWWVLLLLAWHLAEGLRGYPHYLAYFNQITGRRDAWRHLVDSSLDWGQDLPGLKVWLDGRLARAPGTPAYLLYFGTGSPGYHTIPAEPLDLEVRAGNGLAPLRAGIYCVSATELQAVYYPVRGRWNSRYEEAYRELLANVDHPERLDAGKLGGMALEDGPGDAAAKLARLRTARLLAYLRGREPGEQIGFSILCYDLAEADLARALSGPPPELAPGAQPSGPVPEGGRT